MKISRRRFMKGSACAATALMASPLTGLKSAHAAESDDYKALVCIFLKGGNDAYNMVVPAGGAAYEQYSQLRPGLAIAADKLIPTGRQTENGVALGLHPAMAALQPVFSQGNATIVVNSGQLLEPIIGKKEYQLPEFLMAHNHQQDMWATGATGLNDTLGWAGRMVDRISMGQSTVSPVISFGGEQRWLRAESQQQLIMTPGKVESYDGLDNVTRLNAIERHFNEEYRGLFTSSYATHMKDRFFEQETLKQHLENVELSASYPDTRLGETLAAAARMISIRGDLGHRRQVYYMELGGFDTHGNQQERHQILLQQLADAMAAFHANLKQMGLLDNVTTFTMSDFGRRIIPNESGTDHGWAGHQLIMGGAVNGEKACGRWPDLSPNGPYDSNRGRIIPEIAADQVNATLAQWFGYPDAPETLFPALKNGFDSGTLDFLI
ncbi:DUF1501 domain-containing protein [Spongorhabdus nitratireducens]